MNKLQFVTVGALASVFNIYAEDKKPNLVFIMCDQLTFRTLGCYRELLSDDLAFPWGPGVCVETPNIDRIAREGLIHNKLYPTCPVSGPSRGTLFTGMYPFAINVPKNELPLPDGTKTLGTELVAAGYKTSYIGKWHLNGQDPDDPGGPQWGTCRPFGFTDNKYMANDGHWPWVKVKNDDTPQGLAESSNPSAMPYEESGTNGYQVFFVPDFLTIKAIQAIERDKSDPFCVVLSFPQPHTPRVSRADYLAPYNAMKIFAPKTAEIPNALRPKWTVDTGKNEVTKFLANDIRNYFGMVKNIDDNVGLVLKYLDDNGLTDNTIVVFTADHGDMLYEHKRNAKNLPYEASGRVPYLIRYPNVIPAGKVINSISTNANVVPTLLDLMNVNQITGSHGTSDKADFISDELQINKNNIIYTRGISGNVAYIMDNNHKLAVSSVEKPFLFDLQKDPDEVVNFFNDPSYNDIVTTLINEGQRQMQLFKDPVNPRCFSKVPSLPVSKKSVSGVAVDTTQYSLPVNVTDYVFSIISPIDASNHAVTWSSSNPGVASVESNGIISGLIKTKNPGTTMITATSVDGGFKSSYTLTVKGNETQVISNLVPKVNIYPNPFVDELIIEFPDNIVCDKIEIFDVTGRILLSRDINSKDFIKLNSANFEGAGIYYLNLYGKNFKQCFKLIKK